MDEDEKSLDENGLAKMLMSEQGMSEEEARTSIDLFKKTIADGLKKKKELYFPEFGKFIKDSYTEKGVKQKYLLFVSDKELNKYLDSAT